jgi:hypothetical protein
MPTTKITNRSLGINVARDNLGASSTMGTFLSSSTATDLRLAMGVSNTTGTGTLVFSTSPTITTPTIGQINILGNNPLAIVGSAISQDGILSIRNTNSTQNSVIRLNDWTTGSRGVIGIGNTASALYPLAIYMQGTAGVPLVLGTDNTERMRILSGGNVGIGTSTPNERLTLSGNISATGTIIASNYNPATSVAAFLSAPTSANLAAAVSDETGTGSLVFNTSPNFTGTPTISSRPILSELGFQRAFLSTDYTTTAFTTISSFSLNFVGGKTYKLEMMFQITGVAGSTHGGVLAGTFNLSAANCSMLYRRAGFETQSFVGASTPFSGFALFNSTGTATQICFLDGVIKPSTSGALTVAVGGTAAAVTLQKGAYMEATLLD